MKRVPIFLLIVAISLTLAGCNKNNSHPASDNSGKRERQLTSETTNKKEKRESNTSSSTSDESEKQSEEPANIDSTESEKPVEINLDSPYSEGSRGYEVEYRRAKEKALLEQAPDEYKDYIFLVDALDNFKPSSVVYQFLTISTEEQKSAELSKIKENVAQALVLQEQMKEIKQTINLVKEYSELNARVRDALAQEKYLN